MDVDPILLVVRTSVACAASTLVVLLLRQPARRWFGAKTTYRLWMIVPLAMAASLLPQPIQPVQIALPIVSPVLSEPSPATQSPLSYNWLLAIWGAGVVVSFIVIATQQVQFVRTLGKPFLDGDGLPILRARDGYSVGPAVVGIFSPRIVLPADFESRYTADEQRVILAHERAHLFGHDPQANAVVALLQCLNWFNPLAYIAARTFRIDQELAADATVVAQFPKHQKIYAEALLKTQIASHSLPLGCQWPARSEHPLRQRVALLRNQPARQRSAAVVLATLAVGASVTAWAASPRLELPGFGATRVVLWTVLKANSAPPADPQPTVAPAGSWTRLSFKLPDGTTYVVHLNPTILANGQVQVRALVEDNGALTEAPSLFLKGPEPGVVRLKGAGLVITAGAKPDW